MVLLWRLCKSGRTVYCIHKIAMVTLTLSTTARMKARVPASVLDALWEYVEESSRQRPCNASLTNQSRPASGADFKHVPILRATQKTDVCETRHEESEEESMKWLNAEDRKGKLVEVVTPNDLGNGDFTIRPSLTVFQRVCEGMLSFPMNHIRHCG